MDQRTQTLTMSHSPRRLAAEALAIGLGAAGMVVSIWSARQTTGDLLALGAYAAIAGLVVLVVGGSSGRRRLTILARLVVALALLLSIPLLGLAVVLCGPAILAFTCQA